MCGMPPKVRCFLAPESTICLRRGLYFLGPIPLLALSTVSANFDFIWLILPFSFELMSSRRLDVDCEPLKIFSMKSSPFALVIGFCVVLYYLCRRYLVNSLTRWLTSRSNCRCRVHLLDFC
ncbi:hypothetical protein BKA56DRAFT_598355 [Ilyonectria sp. MPI-CAGE-AT-0026]|nr:hypothetical protein BKA56DRAFT_598355 [Ilyonectria sp. MPI-CAGE-AT-0026]